jgi:hypothetical protein
MMGQKRNGAAKLAVCATFAAIALLGLVGRCYSQIVLYDGNSTAAIDPFSQAGMFHWDIQGQNQLAQQWFWYGVGAGAVRSIDTISAPNIQPISVGETKITYASAGNYAVSVDYLLTGGPGAAPGQTASADIGESIRIMNLSGAVLPFHFYQYSHFNLNGGNSDVVQLGQNLHGLYNEAVQTASGGSGLSETVTTPGANEGEVAPVGGTLAKLNGGGPVTLGPPFFSGPLGPGAVTWALQWDLLIAPGSYALISKDKYLSVLIIPEPSAFALLGFGAFGLWLRRRGR